MIFVFFFLFFLSFFSNQAYSTHPFILSRIKNTEDVARVQNQVLDIYKDLIEENLVLVEKEEINKENACFLFKKTFLEIDTAFMKVQNLMARFYYYLYSDNTNQQISEAIQESIQEIQKYTIQNFYHNKKTFLLLNKINFLLKESDELTREEKLFIKGILLSFIEHGIDLQEEQLTLLQEKLIAVSQKQFDFQQNLQNYKTFLVASKEELEGVPLQELGVLPLDEKNRFVLRANYPTFEAIMNNCKNREIRKSFFYLFRDQGYPENLSILEDMRKINTEIAVLLGKKNFASYDIENQSVGSVEAVEVFLSDVKMHTLKRAEEEREKIISYAKEELFKDKHIRIEPWDVPYILKQYEKKYFSLDEDVISQYFELQSVISKLFSIIQQFFGIEISEITYNSDWKVHPSIRIVELKKQGQILGQLILDLFPREGKYKHFAFSGLVDPCQKSAELPLGIIMGNFSAFKDKEITLLRYDQIITLFHEFGHALHFFLAKTSLHGHSGTKVTADLVEVPSQVFEQWPKDKRILKYMSGHYRTQEPLADEIISNMIKAQTYDKALAIQRQIMLADLSLQIFKNADKPLCQIYKDCSQSTLKISESDEDEGWRRLCSFGHLVSSLYGPKYYSYLWALAFSVNITEKIKQRGGLLNSAEGAFYSKEILSQGGALDYNDAIKNYFQEDTVSFQLFYDFLNTKD